MERLQRQLREAVQYNDLKDKEAYVNDLQLFWSISVIHDETLNIVEAFNDSRPKIDVKYDVRRWEDALRRFFDIYGEDYNITQRSVGESIRRKIGNDGRIYKQMVYFVERFEHVFLQLGLVLEDGHRDTLINDSMIVPIETELMEQLSLFSFFITEHSGSMNAIKNCTSSNSSYPSFLNETNSIKSEFGQGRYLGSTMKKRLQVFEDHLRKTVLPCLNQPIESLSSVQRTLDQLTPQKTVWNRYKYTQDLRRRLHVRELRVALIHNQRAYDRIFRQFLTGTHKSTTTKRVVKEIVPNMETEMLVILRQIKSEYLDPLVSMIDETFDELIENYKTLLKVRLRLQPYFSSSILDRIIGGMKLWERNLLSLVPSVQLSESVQDNGKIKEYANLSLDQLEGLIEEHVNVYREPITISLSAYRRNLAEVESRLSNLVANTTRLSEEQQKKVSLDDDFIRYDISIFEYCELLDTSSCLPIMHVIKHLS